MRNYQILHPIGSGNFSTVFKAVSLKDQSCCAIKVMNSHRNIAYREAQILKKMKHPNIITIIDYEETANDSYIFLQFIGLNTLQLYQSQSHGLREQQVKCILFQAALGLSSVHSIGIIHRDIKPENILVDKKTAVVKIVDFGLAIEQSKCLTDYVATRWYRAPQNLLGTKQYSCAIDVFSLGCVILQLYLGSPLFPGSNNIDQMSKIFNVLGFPTARSWPRGFKKMMQLGIKQTKKEDEPRMNLKSIMHLCDFRFREIVEKMLEINPRKRITCNEILNHPYFWDIKPIIPPQIYQRFQTDILNCPKFPLPKHAGNEKMSDKQKINKRFSKVYGANPNNSKQKQKQKQHHVKFFQVPQFLRKKKSSSLGHIESKILKNQTFLAVKEKKKEHQHETLKRKTSTPAILLPVLSLHKKNQSNLNRMKSNSNVQFSQQNKYMSHNHAILIHTAPQKKDSQSNIRTYIFNHTKNPSNFSNNGNKEREKFEQKTRKKSTSEYSEQQKIILKDSTSNMTPDSTSISLTSKVHSPICPENQIKPPTTFSQTQFARNMFYPQIPNIHLSVKQNQQVVNNNAKSKAGFFLRENMKVFIEPLVSQEDSIFPKSMTEKSEEKSDASQRGKKIYEKNFLFTKKRSEKSKKAESKSIESIKVKRSYRNIHNLLHHFDTSKQKTTKQKDIVQKLDEEPTQGDISSNKHIRAKRRFLGASPDFTQLKQKVSGDKSPVIFNRNFNKI